MSGTKWTSPVFISLLVLVLQNSMLVIMTRYSRTNVPPEMRYHTSTLILNQEIVKMLFCIIIFIVENDFISRPPPEIQGNTVVTPSSLTLLWRVVFQKETLKMSVPAALFTLQNYLIFIGLSNLDATTFQVWSQTKLLSAAVFSVVMLGRRLSMMQWMSLFVLTLGVLLTQQQPQQPQQPESGGVAMKEPARLSQQPLLGVAACVLSGLSSSYAGVYFEKVVKTTTPSLAVRNIHLSLFGIPFAALSLLLLDVLPRRRGPNALEFHYWRGYNQWLTIALVAVHAFGGLLVAIVVKYADNVVKGFATGVAVIVSGGLSFIIWGQIPSSSFVTGCMLITFATVMYHKFEDRTQSR
ncbi:UDP-galactose transporter [Trypanosoma theileri]|uniref:UDP-galactose transporter n=1 Tax=Trypanosoma theileri TaxID=67003 RepID=A0A1X0P6Y4_9TRYP|nr:UDP-galactose transporter [Trypanosoma theileri]ORC92628.1 UDP-galactose transporter [Trypanosoma theileri]